VIIEQDSADEHGAPVSPASRWRSTRLSLLGAAVLLVAALIALLVRGQTSAPSQLRLISVIDFAAVSVASDDSSGRLYALRTDGRQIVGVDFKGLDIAQQVSLEPALTLGQPAPTMALDEQARSLYVARIDGGLVSRVDLATGLVTSVAVGRAPTAIAVDSRSHRVYVADLGFQSARASDRRLGNVWVLDPNEMSVRQFVGTPGHLTAMVLDPRSRRLVALGVDPIAGEYVQIIELDSAVEQRVGVPPARLIALDRSGESVYIASEDAVWMLDLRTHAIRQLSVAGSTGKAVLLLPGAAANQYVIAEKRGNVATISIFNVERRSATAALEASADLADVPRTASARDSRVFVLDPHDGRVLVFALGL
jgi:DNA-binding beta-propeller fold protein YncE